ncbi:transferase family protein [Martensiomyces pterosporus]|nr:transferase family protein [Martensiomyces pterosporus]
MDEFLASVGTQVFPLCPMDTLVSLFSMPYVLFFENASRVHDFMPSEILKDSFYKALKKFPILAGHLRDAGKGLLNIVVDKSNLNMPEYTESSSDTHFGDIKAARYSWSAWPQGVTNSGLVPAAGASGEIKLATVHIIRLRDNSGVMLFVSIPHFPMDGTGYLALLNQWASLCKDMRNGTCGAEVDRSDFLFDRSIIAKNLPFARKPLDNTTDLVYKTTSLFGEWLAWISPKTRGALLNKLASMTNLDGHVFRVPKKSLETMRSEVIAAAPRKMRVSTNDLITALVSKTFAQVQNEVDTSTSGGVIQLVASAFSSLCSRVFGKETQQTIAIVSNIRHRLGIVDMNYLGNAMMVSYFSNPLEKLLEPTTAKSLADTVSSVRQHVNNIDAPYVGEFVDMISSMRSCFTQYMAYSAKHPNTLVTSNQTRFEIYGADFGDGAPSWISPVQVQASNLIILLPSPPGDKGVTLYIAAGAPVMKCILKNDYWASVATVIY